MSILFVSVQASYCKKAVGMLLIHVHIHHLQQVLHFLKVHPAIIVLVCLLEPVTNPSEYSNQGSFQNKL